MTTTRALAATGAVGTGFKETTLERAMAMAPDFIGCDAGSTDPGPYYLGAGRSMASPAAIERDLRLMIAAGAKAGVPVLIGSAGTGGGRPHLDFVAAIVRRIVGDLGTSARLATIDAEIGRDDVKAAAAANRLHPLRAAPSFGPDQIDETIRIVAQMGAEPFQAAIEGGADIVLAGRASDAAIFAAVPELAGCGQGAAWHAAKILECGAAAVAQRLYPDCLMAEIGTDDFVVWAPNPDMTCTPQSIASHTLYENADPYLITEPSGVLDTSACTYTQQPDGSVRVTGSRFETKAAYDVKLEAVAFRGHRFLVPGGIRDPLVIGQLDAFLKAARAVVDRKADESLGFRRGSDYELEYRVYGRNGCLGPLEPENGPLGHEVGLHVDIVADTVDAGQAIAALAWHTILHHPIPEWSGLVSNVAFPYSPPEIYVGPVYEFVANHVMEVDDPLSPFPIEYEDL